MNSKLTVFIGEKTTLDNLKKGQKARVLFLNVSDSATRRRFLDMGITEGVQIEIKKLAPLGDPVHIELRGYNLSIRKSDLKMIDAEVIK